jgi:hypothetical protein
MCTVFVLTVVQMLCVHTTTVTATGHTGSDDRHATQSCFKAHATLLRHMFHLTQMGQVTVQLWDDAQGQAAAAAGNANKHAHSLGWTAFKHMQQ